MSNTEERNTKAEDIDALPVDQALYLMSDEDATVICAVRSAIPAIAKAVNEAVDVIKSGGKIFYAGAGTSGRLGVLDASEIPPTFGASPDLFHAIIAGGDKAIRTALEGAEDDLNAGINEASVVSEKDFVIGISASGKTPFVLSFLKAAKQKGAHCWLLTCNEIEYPLALQTPNSELRTFTLDGIIKIITGPEIIAGSTRLKAGTATKLALNMFSSVVMIRLGGVYKGLMVGVAPSNAKLIERALNIIMEITGCNKEEASEYLKLSGMRTKTAIVMKGKGVSKEDAENLLKDAGGFLAGIL